MLSTAVVSFADVSVNFGGKFETKWTENKIQYLSHSVIYAEEQRVIRNRKIRKYCYLQVCFLERLITNSITEPKNYLLFVEILPVVTAIASNIGPEGLAIAIPSGVSASDAFCCCSVGMPLVSV